MKVVHLIASLGYGGAEKLLTSLLPSLKDRGIQVKLVSMNDYVPLSTMLQDQGIDIITLAHQGTMYRLDLMFKAGRKLRSIIRHEQPDIVHSHLYYPDILSRFAVPMTCKLVTTLHSIDPWWQEKNRLRSRGKTWLDLITSRMRQVHCVSVSDEVNKAAHEYLAIPESRSSTVYNGIKLEDYPPKASYKAPVAPIIIQVGRFYREKGHFTSLRALGIIRRTYPDARLLFVGDGPLRQQLESEVRHLQLDGLVQFLGLHKDISSLLRQADIFWMPSEWEGLGIACIEAMACGLPVVASSVGGLKQLVVDGETGFLIERSSYDQLAEKTLDILSDVTMAERFGRAGNKRIEKFFSIDLAAEKYLKIYKNVMDGV